MAIQGENKVLARVGIGLSVLAAFPLLASSVMKLLQRPEAVDSFTHVFGYGAETLVPLGVVEILVAVLYLIPRTRYLGAILATGYLGGAVATHVRIGQPFFLPFVIGMLFWAGLFLRDGRLRELLPLTRD